MDRYTIKNKTGHSFLFLFLLPKHTPQQHLGTTQQRNTQRKPTTRRWIQPRRRRLPKRRALQRHKRTVCWSCAAGGVVGSDGTLSSTEGGGVLLSEREAVYAGDRSVISGVGDGL